MQLVREAVLFEMKAAANSWNTSVVLYSCLLKLICIHSRFNLSCLQWVKESNLEKFVGSTVLIAE